MKFGVLFRLVGLMSLLLSLSFLSDLVFKGENPSYVNMLKKKSFNVGLTLNICRPMSFKVGLLTKTIKLYILIPVWMAQTFIQSHSYI